MSKRRESRKERQVKSEDLPLVINGWKILVWSDFRTRWVALRKLVEELRQQNPGGYQNTQAAKFLKTLSEIVLEEVPSNPAGRAYLHGKSLGKTGSDWRRVKFGGRFRLFFRFNTEHKTIIYAWLNDPDTLRKAGARTDPYTVFHAMLVRGEPPPGWDELSAQCDEWKVAEVDFPES